MASARKIAALTKPILVGARRNKRLANKLRRAGTTATTVTRTGGHTFNRKGRLTGLKYL